MQQADIYQSITNQMLEALRAAKETGIAPWHRPWSALDPWPANPYSGVTYRGSNVISLWMAQIAAGWKTPRFMTFKQVGLYNAQHETSMFVRKGEHGTRIIRWVRWINQKHYLPQLDGKFLDRQTGFVVGKAEAEFVSIRSYAVFNLDQIENVPESLLAPPDKHEWEKVRGDAWTFVRGGPWTLVEGGESAHYHPKKDEVHVPEADRFPTEDELLATVFHELTHWTGHHTRLGRFAEDGSVASRRSAEYAREELVAELGAAFMSAHYGLNPEKLQHVAYLDHYLDLLRRDERAFVHAASQAAKAVDFLLLGGRKAELPEDNHNDEENRHVGIYAA